MKQIYILCLLLSYSFVLPAQWNTDVNTNTAVCTEVFKQKEIRISSDSNGGAFVVWRDYRKGTSLEQSDIYIQKIDSNGYPNWTLNGLGLCVLPSNQGTPSVIKDGKGGVIVAWTDRRTGNEDIYAQRIDAQGNILWAADGIPVCNKPNREHSAKIIADDKSGLIAVWEDMRVDSSFDIWAQRVDSNGNTMWANGGIPVCIENSNRINHKVQRNRKGGAIVTWQDLRSGDYDIYIQNINPSGDLLWGNQAKIVCTASNNQTNPKIDPEKTTNGVFVAWVDKRNNIDYDIYSNRIDSNGNHLWGNSGKAVVLSSGNQSAIDILSNNKTNGLIVTWKDNRASNLDIYAQKLDLNGNALWQNNGVVLCNAAENQKNPNIISDKNGGAIVTWQDKRNGDWDIYAQRVSYNGNAIWQTNGEAISTALDDQTSPKNIPDNKGGTIVCWEDKRNTVSKDIFIHHLLKTDTVTYPMSEPDTTSSISSLQIENISVFPNPFVNQISIELDDAQKYRYSVIDLMGRKIQNIEVEFSPEKVIFNFKNTNLKQGMYFLIIEGKEALYSTLILKK